MANRLDIPELTAPAREIFERLETEHPCADRGTLAIMAQAFADWREARAFIAKEGSTYVMRDKDGQLLAVKELPQVAAARKAEAVYLKIKATLRTKTKRIF